MYTVGHMSHWQPVGATPSSRLSVSPPQTRVLTEFLCLHPGKDTAVTIADSCSWAGQWVCSAISLISPVFYSLVRQVGIAQTRLNPPTGSNWNPITACHSSQGVTLNLPCEMCWRLNNGKSILILPGAPKEIGSFPVHQTASVIISGY